MVVERLMESLDILNLRAGECSFLEIALADVRHFVKHFALDNKKQVALVFPPLSARNRFLIHTLVQNFFNELNTISIGNSHGRRTVVYHSSLKTMLCGTEMEEPNEIHDENITSIRAYRTPSERKAQEKLFHSLMPKKVEKTARSIPRKNKRPDIQIYVPKALRESAHKPDPNINNTINSSNLTPSKPNTNSKIKDDDLSNKLRSNSLCSKKIPSPLMASNLNICQNNVKVPLETFKFVDLSNEMLFDNENKEIQTSFNDVSSQISESLFSSNLPDLVNVNECNPNSSISSEIIFMESLNLEKCKLESSIVETTLNNHEEISTILSPQLSLSDQDNNCVKNMIPLNIPDFQEPDINIETIADNLLEFKEIIKSLDSKIVNSIITTDNNMIDMSNVQQDETYSDDNTNLKVEIVNSSTSFGELLTENNSNCPHYCLDDSFNSGIVTDVEEKNSNIENEELTIQQEKVEKKKKKKKILDLDECSWEDLYDKEDDYIHPLLMKELVSTMGKVQVQCAKEDYRNHQTIEERSGDGECVIEVYGFSSDLKTIDLMNQFAAFRKKHFEIIWVNDTHALAVFESPNLADQALNTPFALVKTRPLKKAIRESKLKAETVAPLPATRPKTCTSLARRLVSSALGLKMDVSPDLLNKERTLLASAKDKKFRDAQLKHNIWNSES